MNDANAPVAVLEELSAKPPRLTRSALRKLARDAAEGDRSLEYERMTHADTVETDDSGARLAKANAARAANPEFEALMVEYQASMNEMARQRKKAVDAGEVEPMWWERATHEEMLRRQRSAESKSAGSSETDDSDARLAKAEAEKAADPNHEALMAQHRASMERVLEQSRQGQADKEASHYDSDGTDDSEARWAKAKAARATNPEFEAFMVEHHAAMNEMGRQHKEAVDAGEVDPWWEKPNPAYEEMLRRQRSAELKSAGSWDSGHIPTAESQNRSHAMSESHSHSTGASSQRMRRRPVRSDRSLWNRKTEFRLLRKEMIAESKYRAMAPYGTFDVAAFQDEPKPDLQSDEEIDTNSAVPGNFPPHQHVSGLAELGTYLASSAYVVSLGGPPLPDMKYGIIVVPIGDEGLLFQGHGDHASRPPDLDKQIYEKSKELDRQEGEEELRKQTEAIKAYNNGEDIEDPLEDYERSLYRQRWVKRMEREGWYRNGAPIKYDDIFQHGKSEAPGLDRDHQDNFESRRQSYADQDFDAHHPPETTHSIAEVEDMIPEAGKALESLLTWEEPKQKPSRFRSALKSLLGISKSSNRKKTVTASRDLLVSVLVGIRELTYGHEPVNPGVDPDIWQAALKKFGPAAHGG